MWNSIKVVGTILNWLRIDATVWLSAFMTAPREMICCVRQRVCTKLLMRESVLMWQNVMCDIQVRTAWTIRLGLSYAHLKVNTMCEQIYNTCVSVHAHAHSFRVVGLLNYWLENSFLGNVPQQWQTVTVLPNLYFLCNLAGSADLSLRIYIDIFNRSWGINSSAVLQWEL